ncbi:hypothetical protein [Vibrio viridaestus]|uniref:Uncharacterized protein n=1 Tax=Vibrio viridaestus TaxID=2487322 RepID=A0A3N9U6D7_9VIBR|nr:hypothetical protein [Vibrio viridaestus]RQW63636.1 hypothetical protein EES38_10350 [Vibrio viridaestus]
MKASEMLYQLQTILKQTDPEIVTGEDWLPERLINLHQLDDLLFLKFDSAPEEGQGDEEGRGFVEHEIELIRQQIMEIFLEKTSLENKQEAILALILLAHEQMPSDVVQTLNDLKNQSS